MQILKIKFKKDGNRLIIKSNLAKEQYKLFVESLNQDDIIEALFELQTQDNTKAQLAKIHVCIKIMADEQGSSIRDMKEQVKDECGMSYMDEQKNKVYESFAKCSKKELSNVIETCIQMARFMNITTFLSTPVSSKLWRKTSASSCLMPIAAKTTANCVSFSPAMAA